VKQKVQPKRLLSRSMRASVAIALNRADSAEDYSEVLELLCSSAAMCISLMSRGDPRTMNELAEGATQYIFERTTGFQKFGLIMSDPNIQHRTRTHKE
jgi:hypothetical protein